jgi:hypothetical protein
MALIARDESANRPRGGGGKLNRSETITVRLDPKLNYLCELAARAQRRTKSSFVEWAIDHALGAAWLPEVTGWNNEPMSVQDLAKHLWQVDEADRVMILALKAPALLTHDEQLIWRLVRENGSFWWGSFTGPGQMFKWTLDEESLMFDRVRDKWALIKAVAAGEKAESEMPSWCNYKPSAETITLDDSDLSDDLPF